jgi:uncharacterized membrane protein YbjE (DUF340 family)
VGASLRDAASVASGFGWYTLSSVLLAREDPALGALAFLTNVFREVIALVTIPIIARTLGHLEAIAPAGATAMDTTLPVIDRSTSAQAAVVAFITGVLLSMAVPFVVPLIYGMA